MKLLLSSFLFFFACTPSGGTPITTWPPTDADAAMSAPDGGDPCSLACAKIADAGCLPGLTSVQCATACSRDQAQGVAAQLSPACVLAAKSLTALQACGACQ